MWLRACLTSVSSGSKMRFVEKKEGSGAALWTAAWRRLVRMSASVAKASFLAWERMSLRFAWESVADNATWRGASAARKSAARSALSRLSTRWPTRRNVRLQKKTLLPPNKGSWVALSKGGAAKARMSRTRQRIRSTMTRWRLSSSPTSRREKDTLVHTKSCSKAFDEVKLEVSQEKTGMALNSNERSVGVSSLRRARLKRVDF